ncbi:MAG: hypothetical protein ACJ8E3_10360 [Sphingomicrobium sp.]
MHDIRTKIASTAIAAALIFSPTVAVASTYPTQAPASGWVALSQMTPAGATALAGAPDAATLAAAQSTVAYDEPHANPLPLPVIAVLLAVLGTAIYIALIEDHDSHGVFELSPD